MNIEPFRSFVDDPARAAILTDFDGTLSAIVDHPDNAAPMPGVVTLFEGLVGTFGCVGVVSGRPVEFLRRVLPVAGLELVGQYGLERWVDGEIVVDPSVGAYTDAVAAVATAAEAQLPGIFVERKGNAAVTLHWRTRAELGDDATAWATQAAATHGLSEYPTKMAVELRPPVALDKGTGVGVLAAGARAALFAGDDHGDLAAFVALDDLTATGRLATSVRIAVRSAEAPPELLAMADVIVDGPGELVSLFAALVDAARSRG